MSSVPSDPQLVIINGYNCFSRFSSFPDVRIGISVKRDNDLLLKLVLGHMFIHEYRRMVSIGDYICLNTVQAHMINT